MKGRVISITEWLSLESFMEPTQKLLLSACRLNQWNDRLPFECDPSEMATLKDIRYALPKFNSKKVFVGLN